MIGIGNRTFPDKVVSTRSTKACFILQARGELDSIEKNTLIKDLELAERFNIPIL